MDPHFLMKILASNRVGSVGARYQAHTRSRPLGQLRGQGHVTDPQSLKIKQD